MHRGKMIHYMDRNRVHSVSWSREFLLFEENKYINTEDSD